MIQKIHYIIDSQMLRIEWTYFVKPNINNKEMEYMFNSRKIYQKKKNYWNRKLKNKLKDLTIRKKTKFWDKLVWKEIYGIVEPKDRKNKQFKARQTLPFKNR